MEQSNFYYQTSVLDLDRTEEEISNATDHLRLQKKQTAIKLRKKWLTHEIQSLEHRIQRNKKNLESLQRQLSDCRNDLNNL